jgi:hypothetical protein
MTPGIFSSKKECVEEKKRNADSKFAEMDGEKGDMQKPSKSCNSEMLKIRTVFAFHFLQTIIFIPFQLIWIRHP